VSGPDEGTGYGLAELQKFQGIQASDARQIFQNYDRRRRRPVISKGNRAHLSKEISMPVLRGDGFPAEVWCNDSAHQRPCRNAVRSSKVMDVAGQALHHARAESNWTKRVSAGPWNPRKGLQCANCENWACFDKGIIDLTIIGAFRERITLNACA
jgi:hypothetical protein